MPVAVLSGVLAPTASDLVALLLGAVAMASVLPIATSAGSLGFLFVAIVLVLEAHGFGAGWVLAQIRTRGPATLRQVAASVSLVVIALPALYIYVAAEFSQGPP